MAKFEVMITEHIQRSVRYEVQISQKEVVDALGLEGEDKKEWKERVQEYVGSDFQTILYDNAKAVRGDVDESQGCEQIDVDDVTEL